MFWDRQCDLLEFMSRGVYCETFKRWGVHTEQRVWDAECQHFFFFLCFMTMIQLHSILCSKSKSNHLMQPDTNGPFHLQPWLSIKWLTPLRVLERFLAGHHVDNQDDIKGFVWEWLLWWECIINHAMIQCFSFLHSKHNLLSQHPVYHNRKIMTMHTSPTATFPTCFHWRCQLLFSDNFFPFTCTPSFIFL